MIGHTVMPRRGGRDGPPSRGKEDSLGGALAIEAQRQLVQIADVEIKRYEQLLADPDPVQEQPVRQRWPGLAGPRLQRAGFQDNLDVPAAVVPGRPDSGVEVDPSDQAVSPILVHRAQPRVDKSGATLVDHQGIIPRASSYALICSQAEAVTARLG